LNKNQTLRARTHLAAAIGGKLGLKNLGWKLEAVRIATRSVSALFYLKVNVAAWCLYSLNVPAVGNV
jgi:hypothetical protein